MHIYFGNAFMCKSIGRKYKFLKNNNLDIDLTYHKISFGILNRNNIKTSMINFIILIAKYWISASKNKMQRPTSEGFLKILHERKETEQYIALANVSEGAKIRNRYNQVPHLTKDTNGKVTISQ